MMQLYMALLGYRPQGRLIEQHDIFFDVANSLPGLVPAIKASWPGNTIHIDCWRLVTHANGYSVSVVERERALAGADMRLFFINLGGYKPGEFDEFHYKMVIAAADKGQAIQMAKRSAFYKHFNFPGASSHIDDKYGIDVDDVHDIADILPAATSAKYAIVLNPAVDQTDDVLHIGYFNLSKVAKGDITSS